jgi:hypothetical protein
VDQQLLARNEYLASENRILKSASGGDREEAEEECRLAA